jgi:hypothetical protein
MQPQATEAEVDVKPSVTLWMRGEVIVEAKAAKAVLEVLSPAPSFLARVQLGRWQRTHSIAFVFDMTSTRGYRR